MKAISLAHRLAVCSWSLRPADPAHLMAQLKEVGVFRVQIALDPLRANPVVWSWLPGLCAEHGVALVSGMFGSVGEDYTTLESIQRTGGVMPDSTWDQNWRNLQACAEIAQRLGLKLVTFHGGFMPHDPGDPASRKLLERISLIADLFASKSIDLALETGQESADTLRAFLEKLNRPSVGVNFDPANMILYDQGDPVAALGKLGPWLKQCHIKDAVRTNTPGTWGQEVPVGAGEVDWRAFLERLESLGFKGDLAIEREAGVPRVADIRAAREYLERLQA